MFSVFWRNGIQRIQSTEPWKLIYKVFLYWQSERTIERVNEWIWNVWMVKKFHKLFIYVAFRLLPNCLFRLSNEHLANLWNEKHTHTHSAVLFSTCTRLNATYTDFHYYYYWNVNLTDGIVKFHSTMNFFESIISFEIRNQDGQEGKKSEMLTSFAHCWCGVSDKLTADVLLFTEKWEKIFSHCEYLSNNVKAMNKKKENG